MNIFAPITDCISEINDTQIDNAKDVDVVTPIDNLIEISNIYSKTPESLWQYSVNKSVLTKVAAIAYFSVADNSALFKLKQ